MKRPPQKNSVEWVAIHPMLDEELEDRDDYQGVEVGLKFVGPRMARGWALALRRLYLSEQAAATARADGKDDISDAGLDASIALNDDVLAAAVVGMRGVEGLGEDDAEAAIEIIQYLGVEAGVSAAAQSLNTLSARQRFRPENFGRRRPGAEPAGA